MKPRTLLPLFAAELSLLRSTSHEHPITVQRGEARIVKTLIDRHLLERHPDERKCVRTTDAGEKQSKPLTPNEMRAIWKHPNNELSLTFVALKIASRVIAEAELYIANDPNCVAEDTLEKILTTFQKLVLA